MQVPVPPALLVDMGATEQTTRSALEGHGVAAGGEPGMGGVSMAAGGPPLDETGILHIPQLACQLHPSIMPSVRRSAVLRLAR